MKTTEFGTHIENIDELRSLMSQGYGLFIEILSGSWMKAELFNDETDITVDVDPFMLSENSCDLIPCNGSYPSEKFDYVQRYEFN